MLYVFTTCALNFVPCAKLLAASVRQHLAGAQMVLGLADAMPDGFRLEEEGFDEVFALADFTAELGNPRGWAFGHSVMELATALKPFVATRLLERADCEAVLFFDPDCVLFEALPGIQEAVRTHSVVLTPHASLLHENASWIFFEKNPLKVGSFNLGFFALNNNEIGRAVASWWRFRLKEHCLIDPEQGLFTDQKWFDLLPGYIDDIKVLREPVYNLARWNTFQRIVSRQDGRYFVDGEPLQFIHFSGFYKIGPYVRGLYDRASEQHVRNIDVLQELSLWYGEQLERERTKSVYTQDWTFGQYGNGQEISQADRRRYRSSPELQSRYPDPFSTASLDSFWLYCRKQERVEEEARFAKQGGLGDYIPRAVRTHNTILRQVNEQTNARLSGALQSLEQKTDAFDAVVTGVKLWIADLAQPMDESGLARACDELTAEGLFDPAWYLEANPTVASTAAEALGHFLKHGLREGRSPLPGQSADLLLPRYVRVLSSLQRAASEAAVAEMRLWATQKVDAYDAAVSGIKAWIADLADAMDESGLARACDELTAEGLFDPAWYLEANPTVASTAAEALGHFLKHGLREGRSPLPGQSADLLLARYDRVLSSLQRPAETAVAEMKLWIKNAAQEMDDLRLSQASVALTAEGLFDPDWYLQANPDVAKNGVDPLDHFLRHGINEGRRPIPGQPADILLARYFQVLATCHKVLEPVAS